MKYRINVSELYEIIYRMVDGALGKKRYEVDIFNVLTVKSAFEVWGRLLGGNPNKPLHMETLRNIWEHHISNGKTTLPFEIYWDLLIKVDAMMRHVLLYYPHKTFYLKVVKLEGCIILIELTNNSYAVNEVTL